MNITIDSYIERTKDLLETRIDDERIMMSLRNNEYYGLNPVASRIWDLTEKKIKVTEIIQILIQEFEVENETCEKETIKFLNQLAERKLIILSDN